MQKAEIVRLVQENVWPLFSSNEVHPAIDQILPVTDASRAHEILENGEATGKVVLRFGVE